MSDTRPERRLAAILATDVAGYSRLMGSNEEATLARLNTLNKGVIEPAIEEFRGRIVKTMGDGLLAEFASAVDAVRSRARRLAQSGHEGAIALTTPRPSICRTPSSTAGRPR